MASPQVQSPGQQQWQLVQGFSNLSLQSPQLQSLQPQSQVPPQVVQGFSNLGLQSPQAPQAQWQMLSQVQPQVYQIPSPDRDGDGGQLL